MSESGGWIQMHPSGLKIELAHPDRSLIRIEDLALHTSHLCRYTGGVRRSYSVLEHCWWVSRRAEELARRNCPWGNQDCAECGHRAASYGLLHDLGEAIFNDLSRPLKYLPGLETYRKLSEAWQSEIFRRYGLYGDWAPPQVKQADVDMLGAETARLKQPLHPEWGATCPGGELPAFRIPWYMPMGWPAFVARWLFMRRFRKLFADVPA